MAITTRQTWEEAKRRLTKRFMAANPGTSWAAASAIVSDRHEEIGAEMDSIDGRKSERTGA